MALAITDSAFRNFVFLQGMFTLLSKIQLALLALGKILTALPISNH